MSDLSLAAQAAEPEPPADLLERLASPPCVVLRPSPELIKAFKAVVAGKVEAMVERLAPQSVPVSEPADGDGPAVPSGREPASVDEDPSDEELLELMPQQFRDDLATVSRLAAHGTSPDVTPGIFRVSLNTGALDYARAVLALDYSMIDAVSRCCGAPLRVDGGWICTQCAAPCDAVPAEVEDEADHPPPSARSAASAI